VKDSKTKTYALKSVGYGKGTDFARTVHFYTDNKTNKSFMSSYKLTDKQVKNKFDTL
jgi:hypothetical protein